MFCLPLFFLLFYVPFCLFPPSPGFPQPTPTLTLTLLDMHQLKKLTESGYGFETYVIETCAGHKSNGIDESIKHNLVHTKIGMEVSFIQQNFLFN